MLFANLNSGVFSGPTFAYVCNDFKERKKLLNKGISVMTDCKQEKKKNLKKN